MARKKSTTNNGSVVRKRGWFLQRSYYYETHDEQGNFAGETHDEWKAKVLAECKNVADVSGVEYIAIAFHDNDRMDDGALKPLHVHVLVKYVEAKTQSAVMGHFGISSSQNCQYVKSYADTARYLIHVSESALNERKTIYLPSIVHMTDYGTKENPNRRLDFTDLMATNEDRKAHAKSIDSFINLHCPALRAGEITLLQVQREFVEHCGEKDWKRNKAIFENAQREYFQSKLDYYTAQRNPRDLTTIYIDGRGGKGKSQFTNELAWLFADVLGVHTIPAQGRSTTFDFVQTYQGEAVSVADEFKTGLPVDQFCDAFDPLLVKNISSRHMDKPWFSQYAILNNSTDLERFISNLLYYSGREYQDESKTRVDGCECLNAKDSTIDKAGQVRRRIKFYLTIREYGKKEKWVDVYGLVFGQREKPFPHSHVLLGRIRYNDLMVEKIKIAEIVKTLMEKHDIFDPRYDNFVPYDANGKSTVAIDDLTVYVK
jgi:hypothetical protein